MRVPLHHLCGFMPDNGLLGHRGDALLTEPTGGLVAQIMEGQDRDPGLLRGLRVAGPHAVIGVHPDPDVLTATPTPVATVKLLPRMRTLARYALRNFSSPTPCVRARSVTTILQTKAHPCRLHWVLNATLEPKFALTSGQEAR